MQREILFKAKSEDAGGWVFGLPHYLFSSTTPDSIQDRDGIVWKVDPETVCQYTGLNDKNGVKIFENDLYTDKTDKLFRVCFNNGAFMKIFGASYYTLNETEIRVWQGEVIGSIHDKKEG